MDIIVLDALEHAACVLSNGGHGCPYFADEHVEDLQGLLTYTYSVPADHESAAEQVEERLVLFTDSDGFMRLMRIKKLTEPHADTHTLQVYTESAHIELNEDILYPTSWTGVAPQTILSDILSGTRYEVGDCDYAGAVLDMPWPDYGSCLAAVIALATASGMELRYRATFANNAITHRYVDLLTRRGSDTFRAIEYASNTTSITRTTDSQALVTAMIGVGKPGTVEGTFTTFATLTAADKPVGQQWVGDATALDLFGRLLPGGSRKHLFGVFRDTEETSPTRLLANTRAELARRISAALTYAVDAPLSRDSLGDTLILRDLTFNPPLSTTIRVSRIVRSYSDKTTGSQDVT